MGDHRKDPELSADGRMRRRIAAALAAGAGAVGLGLHRADGEDVNVNAPAQYPQTLYPQVLECVVDGAKDLGP
ncbi:MAG: hypothetical protein M0037_11040, partial [Betaproteobacteria bacterium]|nr:hypothetical protein [Betaproteobacteria bacterium]